MSIRIRIIKFATNEARNHDPKIMRLTHCRLGHGRAGEDIIISFLKKNASEVIRNRNNSIVSSVYVQILGFCYHGFEEFILECEDSETKIQADCKHLKIRISDT